MYANIFLFGAQHVIQHTDGLRHAVVLAHYINNNRVNSFVEIK